MKTQISNANFQNNNLTSLIYKITLFWSCYGTCKDRIWLESRTGMDPGSQSPNNKFVECGRKSWPESRTKILDYRVRRKELYAYICTKSTLEHALILWFENTQVFSFFSFSFFPFSLVFFFCPPFLFSFLCIIYYGFFTVSSTHVWVRCWSSFFPLFLPFLESSILSCKAARSLFMYHLYINAARRLAGQHLMWR